ncbi:DUF1837 domain-containing protein, partial [Patescibacteria group bacterium]|nr:DUF1837 domain-containing protein [Patescibacteria group bacterium]
MLNNISITGITLERYPNSSVYICYIENFSSGLKEEIKIMLNSIFHGAVDAEEDKEIFNYQATLKDFLERYNKKSEEIKKGIIGELLAHLLIPKYINNLNTISIMKNKEEKSLRKGFDIVYYDDDYNLIWYCEVKSGGDSSEVNVNAKNRELLNKAKTTITAHASLGDRRILWQSVLTDVRSTIFNSKKQINIKALLKADYPGVRNRNIDRNI